MAPPTPVPPAIGEKATRHPAGSGHVDTSLAARIRPVSSSTEQLLPLLPSLARLLPGGGLQRGAVVAVSTGDGTHDGGGGASTLAFALLAAASATGSWCAAVGTGHPGILAIAELGVDLDHLALVPHPGPAWPEVVASLLDGMDAVLVCPPGRGRAGAARRLVARARQRRAVLVVLAGRQGWPVGPDVRLTVGGGTWGGVGTGHGHLRGRRVEVVATGRRAAAGTVRAGLWLPTESGTVTPV